MAAKFTLDTLTIGTPCPAAWGEMAGDDRRRFCTHCQKHVHNLTTMSSDAAERLICESAGDLCVRFARDPQTQKIITLDYRPPPVGSRRRAMLTIASILAGCGLSGSWLALKVFAKLPAAPPVPITFTGGSPLPLPQPTSKPSQAD